MLKIFWSNLRIYDRLTFGYLLLTTLLATFSLQLIPIRERLLVSHLAVGLIIGLLIYWGQLRSQTHQQYTPPKWVKLLRDWHPLAWFTFMLFGEFTYLVQIIFSFWIEKYLIRFDLWLFGQEPHLFIQQHVPAWGVELMAFAYWSYYPIILGVIGWYYFSRAQNNVRIKIRKMTFVDVMNRLCIVFYFCYVLFMIVPARSPRHALNLSGRLHLTGGPFYNFIASLQDYVSVVGAAFPSSHVAVAWVAVLTLRDDQRRVFWSLMPLAIALTASIFILQYHYVLDAVFGVLLALVFEFFWRQRLRRDAASTATSFQPSLITEPAANSLT